MKKALRNSIAATAFLVFAGAIVAQPPDWYAHREERFRGERWRGHMFAEIREDLDHVQATAFHRGDQYRIARAKEELNELQADLEAHRYHEAKLDEVIATISRAAADRRLDPRDRDLLNDDVQRLRDFRAHHENWMH